MGLFNQFPYTNFHELNLDWIVSTVKELAEQYVQLNNNFDGLKVYIDEYFQNLDLSEEVRQELQKIVAAGEFDAIVEDAAKRIIPSYMDEYKQEIDAQITGQNNIINQNSVDIDSLQGQVNTIASLPPGSTTGDAELANIRNGANGVTYPNAGSAVRANDENISNLAHAAMDSKSVDGTEVNYFYYALSKNDIGSASCKSYLYNISAYSCVEIALNTPAAVGNLQPNAYTLFDSTGAVKSYKSSNPAITLDKFVTPSGAASVLVTTSGTTPTVTGYTRASSGGSSGGSGAVTVKEEFTDASLWELGTISASGTDASSSVEIRTGFLDSNIKKIVASSGYLVKLYQYTESGTFENSGNWVNGIDFIEGKKYRVTAKRTDGGNISVEDKTTTTETSTTEGVTWEQGGFSTASSGATVSNDKRCRTKGFIPSDYDRVVFSGDVVGCLYGWRDNTYVGASISNDKVGTGSLIQFNSSYNIKNVKKNSNVNKIKIMVRKGDGSSAITPSYISGKYKFYKQTTSTIQGAYSFLTFTRETLSGGRVYFTVNVTKSPLVYDAVQTSVENVSQNAVVSLPDNYNHTRENPYPVIMIGHGTSGYVAPPDKWYPGNADFDTLVRRFNAEGYVVFDVNNCANNSAGVADWGIPQVVEAYQKAFEWIRKRYNVQDQLFVYAISAGCFAGYNFILQNPGKVKAAVFSGVRASYKWVWDSGTTNQTTLKNGFGFTGTSLPTDIFAQWDLYQMALDEKYPIRFVPTKWIFADPSLDNYAVSQSKAVAQYVKKSGNISLIETIDGQDHHNVCDLVPENLKKDVLIFFNRFV